MSQLTDQHTPEHLEGALPTTGHRALSALAKVTLVALLLNALAYMAYLLFSLLFDQDFVPYFFIGSIPAVLAAGTFHIYCTIHTGMNLTIVVQ